MVLAQGIDFGQIDWGSLNLENVPKITGSTPDGVSPGEAVNFFKKVYDLGSKVYELVSKVWGISSSLIYDVTGFTLGEILVKIINATIGIVGVMIEMLDQVL